MWLLRILPVLALIIHTTATGRKPDWHRQLLGVPLTTTPALAPVFHRVGQVDSATRSVVLVATQSNVLGALDPANGDIVWRHVFEADDPIAAFERNSDVVAALSGGNETSTFRVFDVLTGALLTETRVAHPPGAGGGAGIAFAQDNTDVLALVGGRRLVRFAGVDATPRWAWTVPHSHGEEVRYTTIVPTPDAIYLVGLVPGRALHLVALSNAAGAEQSHDTLAAHAPPDAASVLALRAPALAPRVVWLGADGTLRAAALGAYRKAAKLKGAYARVVDVGAGVAAHGMFVAVRTDGSSCVMALDGGAGAGVREVWDFAGSDHAESVFSGGFDKEGRPYVARVYWSHVLETATIDVFAPHLGDGQGLVYGSTFPFSSTAHGTIAHAALDAANPEAHTVISRFVVTTTAGAVQLWQQGETQWTREEALAHVEAAVFVGMPAEKKVARGAVQGFRARVGRQVRDAKDFPRYALNFAKRFAGGTYTVPASSPSDPLARDAFGFRQVVVAASAYGKLFALDTSTGDVLWSRLLGLGAAARVGGRVVPLRMDVLRDAGEGGQVPEVVVVTQRIAHNTLVDTVVFRFNALTGEDAREHPSESDVLQGDDVIPGPAKHVFFDEEHRVVIMLDEEFKVHIYPDTPTTQAALAESAETLHLALHTPSGRLTGHHLAHPSHSTWTLALPAAERLQTIVPPSSPRARVASIGRVLGNRTTLYKYLNPHLLVALTAAPAPADAACGVYLVDGVKGAIVHRARVPARADGTCAVRAVLSENRLVYLYFDPVGEAKGFKLVVAELYEGGVDEKYSSEDMSSYLSRKSEAYVVEQSFIFLHDITAMAPTSTRFGVTSKDIIVATTNRKIYSIARNLLDPRRPNRKLTSEEQEVYMVQYDPVLLDDPRRTLSHTYEVANVRRIITAPSLLESTSLVFAYGLDLFFTRVAPSNTFDVLNENFNKAQLVFTVSGLAVAITFAKPMVRRKMLRERWYQ